MKDKPMLMKLITGGSMLFFLAAVVISFGICLTGCDTNVTSVEDVQSQEEVNFFELTYDPVELAKKSVEVDEVTVYTGFISAVDGGVIFVDEPELAAETFDSIDRLDATNETSETLDAFIIQPYSIPSDTTFLFEVTKYVTVDGDMPIVFDCNPDGLQFSKPAILLINAWDNFGKKTETVCFYYLNETTNKWVLLEEVPVSADGVAATQTINHFSKYGTDAPQKGGGSIQ